MNKVRLALSRRWHVIFIGFLFGAIAGGVTAQLGAGTTAEQWTAEQVVFVNFNAVSSNGAGLVAQGAQRMVRGAVPERAAEILGGDLRPEDLATEVEAKAQGDSFSIAISTTQDDPKEAARIVEAFADAFVEVENAARASDIQKDFDDVSAKLDEAQQELDAFVLANANPLPEQAQAVATERRTLQDVVRAATADLAKVKGELDDAAIYSKAGADKPVPAESTRLGLPESVPLRALVLGFVAAVLSLALVFFLERLNPRFDTRDEVIDKLGIPVIGEIGELPRRLRQGRQRNKVSLDLPSGEAYRRVRSTFQFIIQRRTDKARADGLIPEDQELASIFMVVSAAPDEGKSTSVAMTALAMAEIGVPTLVVGCDYRRPTIDQLLGVNRAMGITARAEMSVERPELSEIIHDTEWENLWVTPSGAPTTNVVGCADVAAEVMQAARDAGINAVVDTTPVLAANDAVDLLPLVDEIILVIRSGQTSVRSAQQLIEQLRQHGRNVLGVVLVGSPMLNRMQAYYSEYYYSPSESPPLGTTTFSGKGFARRTTDPGGDGAQGGNDGSSSMGDRTSSAFGR